MPGKPSGQESVLFPNFDDLVETSLTDLSAATAPEDLATLDRDSCAKSVLAIDLRRLTPAI
jgi:hypothetical protein